MNHQKIKKYPQHRLQGKINLLKSKKKKKKFPFSTYKVKIVKMEFILKVSKNFMYSF
jgi:hypothetical protein